MIKNIINKDIIKVTNSAWKKIDFIAKTSNNKQGMLFSVQGGGCNGFNYKLNLIDEDIKNLDKYSFVKNGNNKVFVDPIAEIYLIGTTIDYISEDFSKGIYENKFKFIPEKDRASTCGCGVSFSPKNL
tara:strand:- start:182 stop:565 length:384 start_codon:yes stop_codon:yes gene_type:complete